MEYIKIYGSSKYRSEPFILGVSDDQYLINGFKEEWYYIIHDYEIVHDNNFSTYSDYYILEFEGRFLTDKMLTSFYSYYSSKYDEIVNLVNVIEADLDIFKFNDEENDVLMNGFYPLLDLFSRIAPTELEDMRIDGCVRIKSMEMFNVEKLIDTFLEQYEIDYDY